MFTTFLVNSDLPDMLYWDGLRVWMRAPWEQHVGVVHAMYYKLQRKYQHNLHFRTLQNILEDHLGDIKNLNIKQIE